VDHGQTQLEVLRDAVADSQNFVRAVLKQDDSGWAIRYLDVVAKGCPPGWQPDRWEYGPLAFVAEQVPGLILAEALVEEGEGRLQVDRYDVVLPALQQQVTFQHQPSLTRHDTPPLPWPVCEYKIHRQYEAPHERRPGLLVGTDCPSFPTFETAFRAFFHGDFSTIGAGPVPTEAGRFRIAQLDAWLRRIRVTPTHLDVWIAGEAVQGARIEVNGSTWRTHKRVGKTGKVRLRLPTGVPEDAWLYLSRDGRWLDYRALGHRLTNPADLARTGVQMELPDDPDTQIEALISFGEGPRIEYKSTLPRKITTESKRTLLKTVAAFANGDGGSILFGMNADEVTVEGLPGIPQEIRDRLGNLIRGNLVPPDPNFDIKWAHIDGELLVLLEVKRSPGRPYGLKFGDKPVEFYVRRGASTYPATQGEVRNLVITGTQSTDRPAHRLRPY